MIPPVAMLLAWPVIVSVLSRHRGPGIALIIAILGGYLFLPGQGGIDLPGLYKLNKRSIPAYTALVLCMIAVSRAKTATNRSLPNATPGTWLDGWLPKSALLRLLIATAMAGTVMTAVTNDDPIIGDGVFLPGLRLYDSASLILILFITLVPLLLGRKFLAHPNGQKLLLIGFCIAGLLYVPLVFIEVRMSPQLTNWIYGFAPRLWLQHIRGDGFRPIVFLSHGLRVSIFLSAALVITTGLARIYCGKLRAGFLAAASLLFVALVLSKSLGALLIAIVICPLVLFAPRRFLILSAAGMAVLIFAYPALRSAGMIPVEDLDRMAASISEDRAQSLSYRFHYEERLLDRANERPFFGWGTWGRNLYLGGEVGVPDGEWVLVMGRDGWVGFICRFGLMFFPVLLIFWRWRRDAIGMESAVIAAALGVAAIDLIPNSGMTPDKWLLAGALWGRLELGRVTETADEEVPDPPALRLLPQYNRSRPLGANKAAAPLNRYTRQTQPVERPKSAQRPKRLNS